MDGESRNRQRESGLPLRREQRWSMSSQTLEQIVAALMKPVSHFGQSFDRDDSGMLEEYLTAAGLHALEEEEAGRVPPPPNYAEIGMLLQSCANNYSKKVDLLSKLVYAFRSKLSNRILNNTTEDESSDESPVRSPTAIASVTARARRRRDSSPCGFAPIELVASDAVRRSSASVEPPPTLPRGYAELQPRSSSVRPDRALTDHAGEAVGALEDFHVSWRLQDGYLVEGLQTGEGDAGRRDRLRPLSLIELQAACTLSAAPDPPALCPTTPPPGSPDPAPSPDRLRALMEATPPPAAFKRKRRGEMRLEDLIDRCFRISIDAEARRWLCEAREFNLCERWVRRVVRHRALSIAGVRQSIARPVLEFRGWTDADIAAARENVRRVQAQRVGLRDDGAEDAQDARDAEEPARLSVDRPTGGWGAAWQEEVARAALARGSEGLDLTTLSRDVWRVLPPAPAALPWLELVALTAESQPRCSHVLVDVLLKATAGEVIIEHGPPLSIGEFAVAVVMTTPIVDKWRSPDGGFVPPGNAFSLPPIEP